MSKRITFIILLICNFNFLKSQTIFSGFISTNLNNPIENANVILFKKNNSTILAFAISDSKGFFEIKYDGKEDSVIIKVSIIGYESKSILVANKSQSLNFIIKEENTVLPTVTVKESPIFQNGDTTNYLVKKFIGKEDRVIGDVIAKLPGIEIDAVSGAIKFNGKPISHYYIDGLDLLEKKYNIANKNIPADMVDQVQVLDNHQDIKLLDSLVKGTEPALNIKLKKTAKNKLVGKAKVGVGVTPLLWDNEITGLQFNPDYQLITSYKNNNSGIPLSNEISDIAIIQKVGDNTEKNIKEELINKLNTQQPGIATVRYLLNNSNLLFFNTLKVLKNKAQLKFSFSYLNDNNFNESNYKSTYILPNNQQINFSERKNGFTNTNKLEGNFIYNINTQKKFLKNTSKVKLDYTKEQSNIVNNILIGQTLKNPFYEFSNNLLTLMPLKNKIFTLNSSINYNNAPASLMVTPGQFSSIINQNISYESLVQNVHVNNFNTDNNISFLSKIGKINQSIKIGAEFIHKNIKSNINKYFNQTMYQLNDSFANNLNWNNTRLYAETETTIGKKKRQLDINMPIEFNLLSTNNKVSRINSSKNTFFFNPSVGYRFPLFENTTAEIGYNKQSSIGSFTNILTGYILSNYRNISKNDSLIPIQYSNNLSASIYYKNPLNSIFSNITFSVSNTKRNIIYNQTFDGAFIKSEGIYLNNYQKSFLVNGNTSKYFIAQKINFNLSYGYSLFNTDILQQNIVTQSKSSLINFGFKINSNRISYLSIESNSKFDYFSNQLKNQINSTSSTNKFQQYLKFYFYVTKNSILTINNELYKFGDNRNNKGNYYFGDIGYKKKFKKTELELNWNNVFNTKSFVTFNNTNNIQQINAYQIRPSNFMAKLHFNF